MSCFVIAVVIVVCLFVFSEEIFFWMIKVPSFCFFFTSFCNQSTDVISALFQSDCINTLYSYSWKFLSKPLRCSLFKPIFPHAFMSHLIICLFVAFFHPGEACACSQTQTSLSLPLVFLDKFRYKVPYFTKKKKENKLVSY